MLAAIWGSSFLFMRLGTVAFGPWATAGLRVAIATLFLLPVIIVRGHGPAFARHWRGTLYVGVFNSALPFVGITYALQFISTGLSSILNAAVPLFGALVAWGWLGERPKRGPALGLIVGFIGVALLAGDKAGLRPDVSASQGVLAVLSCLGACLCYAYSASYTKRHLSGVPALLTAGGSQLGASLALLLPTLMTWPQHEVPASAWGAALALGVVCSGLAYILYFRLITQVGPVRALSVTFVVPVFALLYGALFLHERISLWMLSCAAIIIAGTALSANLLRWRPAAARA